MAVDHLHHLELLHTEWGLPSRLEEGASYRFTFEPDMWPDLSRLIPPSMLGNTPLPRGADLFVQTPTGTFVSADRKYATYRPKRGAMMGTLIALGAGGGGGGGTSGAAAAASRNGGGAGGSAGIGVVTLPIAMMRWPLYVCVPTGALGGGAGISGSTGWTTCWSRRPDTATNIDREWGILTSSISFAGGGNTNATGGAAATQGPNTNSDGHFLGFGTYTYSIGQTGATGGTGANGAAGTARGYPHTTGLPTSGGTGGAGTGATNAEFAGGIMGSTSPGWHAPIPGGAAGGGPGVDGYAILPDWRGGVEWHSTGGTGGGSSGTGTGGVGGRGGYGGGGGGGGGGVTAGAGGRGGSGLAIAISW
jgi:hypothetical protein